MAETTLPKRRPLRLQAYDYSRPGAYFVTVCVKDRQSLLGRIVGGGALDAPRVELSAYGKIVQKYILTSNRMANVSVDKYAIMPDHIHLLITITGDGPSKAPAPTNALIPHLVSTLKRFCNREIGRNIFQRSFHDHIIRGEDDYREAWNYIDNNPLRQKDGDLFTE